MTGTDRIAVLGLGAMGLAMARRLSVDAAVTGFDVDDGRRALAAEAGLAVAPSAAAAATGAGCAVISVRTLAQAESCLLGADGAVAGLAPGSLVLLTSTVGADGARALASRLAESGIELVDAPVSGGPARAGLGTLLVLVGAGEDALARARPVLDLLAGTLVVVGTRAGDGQAMKTVNQLLCGVHIAAAAEALALARALGLDPAAALAALAEGAAASFMLSNRGPRIVEALAGDDPEVLSRVDIFVKDMGIVQAAAAAAGLDLPVAAAAELVFQRGEDAGLGARDDSTVATLLAEPSAAAAVSLRQAPGTGA